MTDPAHKPGPSISGRRIVLLLVVFVVLLFLVTWGTLRWVESRHADSPAPAAPTQPEGPTSSVVPLPARAA